MNAFRFSNKVGVLLVLTLLVFMVLTITSSVSAANTTPPLDLRKGLDKLWEDHIFYTRLYVVSSAANLPDQDANAQRLLQNQDDIGNAVKAYYGEEAGNQLTALLKTHIQGAVDILTAAKAGDKVKQDAATKTWYANADDIAIFLNKANPQAFPLAAMKEHMKMHLDLTLAEAVARLQGKFAQDIQDYDKVHVQILGLADALANGIITQFPDRFDIAPSAQEAAIHTGMRKLWEDHIQYTRMYIVSVAAGLPDADATAQRLLQNQVDIGNAIKPYFGITAGEKLTALLKEHILGAVEVLAAAKAGDTAKLDAANKKWYANADEIAMFLNAANPEHWSLDMMKEMMKMHFDLTLAEATAQLKSDTAGSIQAYELVHAEILSMSDGLSNGIIARFPTRFHNEPLVLASSTGMAH